MHRWFCSTQLLVVAFAAVALDCSKGSAINLGDTQALGGTLSDYAGSWDGYAEAYTFQWSNSNRIRIVLDAQGNGTIQVGEDPLLPDPTDPDVGFPAGENLGLALFWKLSAGVLYPVYAARVQVNRLQLGLKPYDFWRSWCALQTSHRVLGGWVLADAGAGDAGLFFLDGGVVSDAGLVALYRYSCVPDGVERISDQTCFIKDDSGSEPGRSVPVDCGKLDLCSSPVCGCTEIGCASAPDEPPDAVPDDYPNALDLGMDNSATILTGTLLAGAADRVTIHLQRH